MLTTAKKVYSANPYKEVVIELVSGPATYQIDEAGYGFAVLECDDQSALIYVDSTNSQPIPLPSIGTISFPDGFQRLFVTNFEPSNGNSVVSLLIFKNSKANIFPISPFRQVADAMTFAQLPILAAGGSSMQYKLWEVDASNPAPRTFTAPNQQQFPIIPLIRDVEILSIASGSEFTLATTALTDTATLTPQLQDPIPSKYFSPLPSVFKAMGYSLVYTPTVTASGTNVFLIGIQQPLSVLQLKEAYNIVG